MMAEIVVDREVPVGRHGENDLRQPFLEPRVLVAEFMARVDGKSCRQAGHEGEAEQSRDAQIRRSRIPGRADQCDKMQRNRCVGQTAVEAIRIQLHDHFLGRVVGVLAEYPVQNRPEPEVEEQRQQQPPFVARRGVQPYTEQWLERIYDRHQPQPALAIDVYNRLTIGKTCRVALHVQCPSAPIVGILYSAMIGNCSILC